MKEIGKDKYFDYFKADFDGIEITIRKRRATNEIFFLVDENFARANGYNGLKDLPEGMKGAIKKCFGNSNAWLLFDEKLGFIAKLPTIKN